VGGVVIERIARDHALGLRGLVALGAQGQRKLGVGRGGDLEPDPVTRSAASTTPSRSSIPTLNRRVSGA